MARASNGSFGRARSGLRIAKETELTRGRYIRVTGGLHSALGRIIDEAITIIVYRVANFDRFDFIGPFDCRRRVDVRIGVVAIAGLIGWHRASALRESVSVSVVAIVDETVAIVIHAVARFFFPIARATIPVITVHGNVPFCDTRVFSNHRSGAGFEFLTHTVDALHSIAARIGSTSEAATRNRAFDLQIVGVHDKRTALHEQYQE